MFRVKLQAQDSLKTVLEDYGDTDGFLVDGYTGGLVKYFAFQNFEAFVEIFSGLGGAHQLTLIVHESGGSRATSTGDFRRHLYFLCR